MTRPTTSPRRDRSRTIERRHGPSPRRLHHRRPSGDPARRRSRCALERELGSYVDSRGSQRELVARAGNQGSVLVLDRDVATRRDQRLVAHLAPDEPPTNAELVAGCYLEQAGRGRCRCRGLTMDDLHTAPFADALDDQLAADEAQGVGGCAGWPVDAAARRYSIVRLERHMSIPQLRWCREAAGAVPSRREPLSIREVIAALEAYEPVRSLSARAIRRHRDDEAVSVAVLRAELTRVNESPIVLNRALREAVLAAVDNGALSMSE
ncbi:MAG: hypothetical protein JWM66_877, partial [Solirubrobacterales bacterium]|nr:hypothetical protein [Solirubrobacterales bacterium]